LKTPFQILLQVLWSSLCFPFQRLLKPCQALYWALWGQAPGTSPHGSSEEIEAEGIS
jgi:hypothetical protein